MLLLQNDSKEKGKAKAREKGKLNCTTGCSAGGLLGAHLWKAAAQKLHAKVGARRALKGPHVFAFGRRDLKKKKKLQTQEPARARMANEGQLRLR